MKLLIQFLFERRMIYGMYLVFWGLIFLTFYLYELSLIPFWDSFLFTFFVLITYSFVLFIDISVSKSN